jgi:hypothetical protein
VAHFLERQGQLVFGTTSDLIVFGAIAVGILVLCIAMWLVDRRR